MALSDPLSKALPMLIAAASGTTATGAATSFAVAIAEAILLSSLIHSVAGAFTTDCNAMAQSVVRSFNTLTFAPRLAAWRIR